MKVQVRKEIELIGVATILRGNRYDYLVNAKESSYIQNVIHAFGDFCNHAFFELYSSNIKPIDLISELDCHYNVHLENVLHALWQFGKDICFDDFFEKNKNTYRLWETSFQNYIDVNHVEEVLQSYYSIVEYPFEVDITLVPYLQGAFVSGYSRSSRERHLYIGNKIEDEKATFLSKKNLGSIFHEMSHLLLGRQVKDILKNDEYFQTNKERLFKYLERQEDFTNTEVYRYYYQRKEQLLEEYIIRAVTLLYEKELGFDVEKRLAMIERAGFLKLQAFYEQVVNHVVHHYSVRKLLDEIFALMRSFEKEREV